MPGALPTYRDRPRTGERLAPRLVGRCTGDEEVTMRRTGSSAPATCSKRTVSGGPLESSIPLSWQRKIRPPRGLNKVSTLPTSRRSATQAIRRYTPPSGSCERISTILSSK